MADTDPQQPPNALIGLIQALQKATTLPPDAQLIHQQHLAAQQTPQQKAQQDQAAKQARAKSDAADERQFETQRGQLGHAVRQKINDANTPAPVPKSKQAQVKQYKAEQRQSQNPMQHLSDAIQMAPGDYLHRGLRQARIDEGKEAWTPMVGTQPTAKLQAHDVQKYKDQRRLAEQQERGAFGQRLSPAVLKSKMAEATLQVAQIKSKAGLKLNTAEAKALKKAQAPGDPANSPGAAIAGTLGVMAPELEPAAELLGPRLGGIASKVAGRFGRGGDAAVKARVDTAVKASADAKAAKSVKPPAGETIGKDIPKNGKTTVQDVMETGPKKADADAAKADERPPLPKADETPKTTPRSRAADAAKNKRKAEINDKAAGPGTAPKKNVYDRADASLKKLTTRQTKFRETLPKNLQARFSKMTPAQREAYMKTHKPPVAA